MIEITPKDPYCIDPYKRERLPTLTVNVGSLEIGGNNPVRLQSMTTVDTMDTEKSVEQSIRMIDAGCELVRLTAPSKKEAENLQNIKNEMEMDEWLDQNQIKYDTINNSSEMAKSRVGPILYKKLFIFVLDMFFDILKRQISII